MISRFANVAWSMLKVHAAQEWNMEHSKLEKTSKRVDRLATIEMADDRTNGSKRDRDRNVGAETAGDPGAGGLPHGDGNTIRSGDTDAPLNSGPDDE
jgi:hypothetical protein